MTRFDVVKNTESQSAKQIPYFLIVQSDFLNHLSTCMSVPMVKEKSFGNEVIKILNPVFEIEAQSMVMNTPLMTGINRRWLGRCVTNLEHKRNDIVRAIDFLLSGF